MSRAHSAAVPLLLRRMPTQIMTTPLLNGHLIFNITQIDTWPLCDVHSGSSLNYIRPFMDYYDVKSILAEETLIPTKLLFGASLLGKGLSAGGSTERDAPAEENMEIPLWLANPLVRRKLAIIKVCCLSSVAVRPPPGQCGTSKQTALLASCRPILAGSRDLHREVPAQAQCWSRVHELSVHSAILL